MTIIWIGKPQSTSSVNEECEKACKKFDSKSLLQEFDRRSNSVKFKEKRLGLNFYNSPYHEYSGHLFNVFDLELVIFVLRMSKFLHWSLQLGWMFGFAQLVLSSMQLSGGNKYKRRVHLALIGMLVVVFILFGVTTVTLGWWIAVCGAAVIFYVYVFFADERNRGNGVVPLLWIVITLGTVIGIASLYERVIAFLGLTFGGIIAIWMRFEGEVNFLILAVISLIYIWICESLIIPAIASYSNGLFSLFKEINIKVYGRRSSRIECLQKLYDELKTEGAEPYFRLHQPLNSKNIEIYVGLEEKKSGILSLF